MSNLESQLQQMLPLFRPSIPKVPQRELQIKSIAKIALGFALGVFVTYHVMLPNDSPSQAPVRTYTVQFDESALQEVRTPADIFRYAVRVPAVKDKPTESGYRELREQLLQSSEPQS